MVINQMDVHFLMFKYVITKNVYDKSYSILFHFYIANFYFFITIK